MSKLAVTYPTIAKRVVGRRWGALITHGWVGLDAQGKVVACFATKREAQKWLKAEQEAA